jgi:type IV secretion system protein VirB11
MSALQSAERRRRMLVTALGQEIAAAMRDAAVVEIMANPDGALRLDRLGQGVVDTGISLAPEQVERIIRLVASHVHAEVHRDHPIISAELPPHADGRAGERFEGVLPPVSAGPCFAIRKPAQRLHTLDDYVRDGVMTSQIAQVLRDAIAQRRNVLIAGGTSSGKTTLANALLAEMDGRDARLVLIEDTRELQSPLLDTVALRTRLPHVTMTELVRSTMRLRPDRIVVGEVRGPEALDMLKAWNTGHPGGIATIHANSAAAALTRLEQLCQEAVVTVPRQLIAEAIDMVVFIAGRGTMRRVAGVERVTGLDAKIGGYALVDLLNPSAIPAAPASA